MNTQANDATEVGPEELDLAAIILSWRTDAISLRRNGEPGKAELLDRCASEAERGAADWLTWLSEQQALDRSGKSPDYFRARREAWEVDHCAKRIGRSWFYRRCIVPRSRLSSVAKAAAKRGEP